MISILLRRHSDLGTTEFMISATAGTRAKDPCIAVDSSHASQFWREAAVRRCLWERKNEKKGRSAMSWMGWLRHNDDDDWDDCDHDHDDWKDDCDDDDDDWKDDDDH